MKAAGGLIAALLAALMTASLSAKGETTRISIAGPTLPSPIHLIDRLAVARFSVWSGAGTFVRVSGVETEGTEGFIIDWTAPVVAPPPGSPRYEVSFFAANTRDDCAVDAGRLVYVVTYERDPAGGRGFVYLPGRNDRWYATNVGSILRGGGREGSWFRATQEWDEFVRPLLR